MSKRLRTKLNPPIPLLIKGGKGGLLVLCFMLFFCSSAFAVEGLSGWLNINYSNTEQIEDGKKTSTSDSLMQNYYLNVGRTVTPMLSYQLYLRTTLSDSHSTDSEDKTTSTYQRAIEPALDIILRNPMYGLSAGYRRLEQWSTAHLSEDSRKTTEYYYSRFDITPYELPSLYLQFDKQKNYDYLSPSETDTTNTTYSGSSAYTYLYKDLNLSYNLTYTHGINETPISTVTKTINDNFNGSYNMVYNTSFWSGRVNVSGGYQGNYGWSQNKQFATQTTEMHPKRMPSGGLYAQGTALQPEVYTLTTQEVKLTDAPDNALSNNPAYTTPTAINIGNNGGEYYNVGVQLKFPQSVDTLYIYVKSTISNPGNITWNVYKSYTNGPLPWIQIKSDLNLAPLVFDSENNIYRYELKFDSTEATEGIFFFKVININKSATNDVFVTEIEAYGTDIVQEGWSTETSTFFTQGLNLNANVRAASNLSFSFGYYINRADTNPVSLLDSIGGIFTNIFSKTESGEDDKLTSNVTKSYNASTTWVPYKLLTTTLRFSRSKAFDNKDKTDVSSNTYSLSFNSSPLPTLDTNLSLTRNDSYSFEEKQSTTDSYVLSIGSRLYRNVNMITDLGYTQLKSYTEDTSSSTSSIRGTLDAPLTKNLYANLTYGFSWTSSDGSSSDSKDGSMTITYRPGQFINLSGSFKVSDTDGNKSASEGLSMDWLPLPAIRLNLSYQHSSTEPETSVTDSLSGYGIWYITKFMEVQFTSNYNRQANEKITESFNIGGNLTCRF